MSLCNRVTAEFSVCLQYHCVKMRLELTMLRACPHLPRVLSQLELAVSQASGRAVDWGQVALHSVSWVLLYCYADYWRTIFLGELKFCSVFRTRPKHVPYWEFPFEKAVVYFFIWTITKCYLLRSLLLFLVGHFGIAPFWAIELYELFLLCTAVPCWKEYKLHPCWMGKASKVLVFFLPHWG